MRIDWPPRAMIRDYATKTAKNSKIGASSRPYDSTGLTGFITQFLQTFNFITSSTMCCDYRYKYTWSRSPSTKLTRASGTATYFLRLKSPLLAVRVLGDCDAKLEHPVAPTSRLDPQGLLREIFTTFEPPVAPTGQPEPRGLLREIFT